MRLLVEPLREAAEGPGPGWPKPRAQGAKALGLRYERAVARALPQARHGVWLRFEDAAGFGWCQPDFVVLGNSEVLVLEAKLTWQSEAHTKLKNLYVPLVQAVFKRPAWGVQVCKHLRPLEQMAGVKIARDLGEALFLARRGERRVALHWIGEGALVPRKETTT